MAMEDFASACRAQPAVDIGSPLAGGPAGPGNANMQHRAGCELLEQRSALSVYSVDCSIMGFRSFAKTLRDNFPARGDMELESAFERDDRELWAWLLFYLVGLSIPSSWVAERNLDFRRFRRDCAWGIYGRRLVDRRLRRQPRIDVLHFSGHLPSYASLRHLRRLPSVISTDAASLSVLRLDIRPGFGWTSRPNFRRERALFDAADRVIFWSEWARQDALAAYSLSPDKLLTIHPGVDVDSFAAMAASRAAGRADHPQADNRPPILPIILFVGNDFERKGGGDLLEVFSRELAGRAELHLMTATDIKPRPGVFLHRGITAHSPEWFELYDRADLFVLPTKSDAFGLAYVEAIAAGLPVVGSRIGAVPEIVAHGEAGFLVDPGDRAGLASALATLVRDGELRRRFGAHGRSTAVAQFDARKQAAKLADVFRAVAHERAKPRIP